MKYLKRLLDPVILGATLANILSILLILGIIGETQIDQATQIVTLIINTLLQIGIMKQPNETKKEPY